jgi:hypothetical protein
MVLITCLKYPNPKYDDAQTIYTTLVNQCDSAVTYFNQAAAYYAAGPGQPVTLDDQYDVVFGRSAGGSSTSAAVTRMQKWIEFANTVKLRLLLHESSVSGQQAFIKSEIAKSLANGGFLPAGTSAAVNPGYSNSSAAQQNPSTVRSSIQAAARNKTMPFGEEVNTLPFI